MTTRERLEKLAERLNAQALSTENAVSPTRRAKRAAVVKRAEARAIGEILARVRSLEFEVERLDAESRGVDPWDL